MPRTVKDTRTAARRRPRVALLATIAGSLAIVGPASAATLPFSLDFNQSVPNSVLEGSGLGTGFEGFLASTNSPAGGYVQANLGLGPTGPGVLKVTTTAGDAVNTVNSQDNALYVAYNPSGTYTVSAKLLGPLALVKSFRGAGIYIGDSEKDYVKLVANRAKTEQIELGVEQNDLFKTFATVPSFNPVQSGLGIGDFLELSLEVDPASGKVIGRYSLNGATPVDAGTVTVPSTLIGDAGTKAGIITTNFDNNTPPAGSPMVVTYDRFAIAPTAPPPPPPPPPPPAPPVTPPAAPPVPISAVTPTTTPVTPLPTVRIARTTLTLGLSAPRSARAGRSVPVLLRFGGTVRRVPVTLQRKVGSRFVAIVSDRQVGRRILRFRTQLLTARTSVLRVRLRAGTNVLRAAYRDGSTLRFSRTVTIRVR